MENELVLFGKEIPTIAVYVLQILVFLFVLAIGGGLLAIFAAVVDIIKARRDWVYERLQALRDGYAEGVVGIDSFLNAFNRRIPIAAPLLQKAADMIDVDDPNSKTNKKLLAWLNSILPDIDLDNDGVPDADVTPDDLLKVLKYLKLSLEEFADDDIIVTDAVLVPELFADLIDKLNAIREQEHAGSGKE